MTAAGASAPETAAPAAAPLKPRMRGWLHAGMFPPVVIAGLALVLLADGTRARAACAVYALSACLLFGVSGIYHRGTWGPRARRYSGGSTTRTSS